MVHLSLIVATHQHKKLMVYPRILRNFATIMKELVEHTNEECVKSIKSAKDALYVLNGK